ncbi:aminoglycoside phosphotransferase family protein [Stackebrandtia soli]|uniref:aminoglycoside phosphotransferase family protein n=1 Tax=Stackebrandtia soli TaxID=1892856 RepID=UPI0039EC4F16
MIVLPDKVRRTAESRGEEGRAWLSGLEGRLERLRSDWSLTLGEVLDGGTSALVVRVRGVDGDAVLKIAPEWSGFAEQIRTIAAADGNGYVRLHAHDFEQGAALMEALGPTLEDAPIPVERKLDVLARTLRQTWSVPRPDDAIVDDGEDKATQLIELILTLWTELGEPCSRRLIDAALDAGRRRVAAFDVEACVVCHGDPHPANALAVPRPRPGAESGYVFVDPDGLLAEPAYDLGVALRGWTDEVLASTEPRALLRGYCHRLARATGIDADAVWDWGFVERVSSGLYLLRYGHQKEGRGYLDSAERLVS